MMRAVAAVCLLHLAGLVCARGLDAQATAYFQTLVVPSRSMGTCMPVGLRPVLNKAVATSRLVMASMPPGYRREIAVSVVSKGNSFSYSDMSFASTGLFSGEGERVFATVDSRGNVWGSRLRTESYLPGSISMKPDSVLIRGIKQYMYTTSSRDSLDAVARRHVLELAKWLRGRCPT